MGTKVKGLLKGLRYISNIFEDKEEELQIGFPTDVKHVAHIGLDGPNTNKPSWMEEYKSAPELAPNNPPPKPTPEGVTSRNIGAGNRDALIPQDITTERQKPPKDSSKHSRRHRSSGEKEKDKDRDRESSSHRSRRSKESNNGSESPSQDSSGIPKHSRRKKSKGSSGDGSTRSTRSSKGRKDSLTDSAFPTFPDMVTGGSGSGHGHVHGHGLKSNEGHPSPLLEVYD